MAFDKSTFLVESKLEKNPETEAKTEASYKPEEEGHLQPSATGQATFPTLECS